MKLAATWVTAIFLCTAMAEGQLSQINATVDGLRRSHPSVKWNIKSARLADVTCDGDPDVMLLGSDENKVVVAVTSGRRQEKSQMLSFPIGRDIQDGFCAQPTRLGIVPLDCETDEGPLSGCKPSKGCRAFTISDEECDAFNFYWDSSRNAIRWWRH